MKKQFCVGLMGIALLFTGCRATEAPKATVEDTKIDIQKELESETAMEDNNFSIDKENIFAIQLNVSRIKDRKSSFQKITDGLEQTVIPQNKTDTIQKSDDYDVVSIIYGDGSKDIFYFFQQGDMWYMETPEGSVYQNADFITDVFESSEELEVQSVHIREPYEWQLELEKETEKYDISFSFKLKVYYNINERAMTLEEAIDDARQSVKTEMVLYQYALKEGYGLTEQEKQEALQKEIDQAKRAENYNEIKEQYLAQGLSFEESLEKQKESIAMSRAADRLYNAKYEEFRHGKDKIGNTVCETVTEYWNAFLMEEMWPQMENYDLGEFETQLDAAEEQIKNNLEM